MGSYVMEKFLGNGSLKQLLPKLLEEGWDDVPALKMMSPQDMDVLSMTQQQKVNSFSDRFIGLMDDANCYVH